MTHIGDSDMDESEGDIYSSPPATIPLPNLLGAVETADQPSDHDGDTTMVNATPDAYTPHHLDESVPHGGTPGTPTPGTRNDPPWIVRRTKKLTEDPPPTQEEQIQLDPPMPTADLNLPDNLIRTPTPIGGFPEIHLTTPPWFNLLPAQKDHFETYPEPKLWIRDWQASKEADLMDTSDKLKDLISRMTGERAKLSTPQQEKDISTRRRNERQNPPFHFLVSDITEGAQGILLSNPIISTPEASAFIVPYHPPVPRFLCTIEGFTLSIRSPEAISDSETEVTRIVKRTLSENEAAVALLKSKIQNDETSQHNMEPALGIIETIDARLAKDEDTIQRTMRIGAKRALWNLLFRQAPPISWASYFVFLQSIREMTFIDMDHGSARLVGEEHRFHCFNCKGADHSPAQCKFTKMEDWYGNKATEKVEETAEFATASHPGSSSDHYRGRNERRGGWGGYGRGRGMSNYRHDRN